MWLEPDCAGPCEIQLDYDGGWELRICRWISVAVLAALVVLALLYRGEPRNDATKAKSV
jgi:hypothetical protein